MSQSTLEMAGFDGMSPEQEAWAEHEQDASAAPEPVAWADPEQDSEAWATEASHLSPRPTPDQQLLCNECPEEARQPANSSCLGCPQVYYCDGCWAERGPHRRKDSKHQSANPGINNGRSHSCFVSIEPAPVHEMKDGSTHQRQAIGLNRYFRYFTKITPPPGTHTSIGGMITS